jgi:hypothetical protein
MTVAGLENHLAMRCDRLRNVAMLLVVRSRSGPRWNESRPLEEQFRWPGRRTILLDGGR